MCSRIINGTPGVQKRPSSRLTAPFCSTSGSLKLVQGGTCPKKLKLPVIKPVLGTFLGLFAEFLDAVEEILPTLVEQQVSVYVLADKCKTSHVETFNDKMRWASSEPVPKELRSDVTLASTAVFIYTSGTTGGAFTPAVAALASSSSVVFISFSSFCRFAESRSDQPRQSLGHVFAGIHYRRNVQRCDLHHPPPLPQRRLLRMHLSH